MSRTATFIYSHQYMFKIISFRLTMMRMSQPRRSKNLAAVDGRGSPRRPALPSPRPVRREEAAVETSRTRHPLQTRGRRPRSRRRSGRRRRTPRPLRFLPRLSTAAERVQERLPLLVSARGPQLQRGTPRRFPLSVHLRGRRGLHPRRARRNWFRNCF